MDTVQDPDKLGTDVNITEEQKETKKLYEDVTDILNELNSEEFQPLKEKYGTLAEKFETLLEKFVILPINSEERLIGVINLIFDKIFDDKNCSTAIAIFCKICSRMEVSKIENGRVQKVNFCDTLITRCQTEFLRNKSSQLYHVLQEIKNCTDPDQKNELQLQFEKKKKDLQRKSVGNVRFIGELFKLDILTPTIVYECIEHLQSDLDEVSLECLSELLTTIGEHVEPSFVNLNPCFQMMAELEQEREGSSSRVSFMLQDVINLWQNKCVQRREDNNSKTDSSRVSFMVQDVIDLWHDKTTEDVKLKTTKNPWKPRRLESDAGKNQEQKDTEKLYKDVRGILNKLTPQKFDTLMKKFMVLPINSEEKLVVVVNLIFDKVVDEPNFSKVYANICTLCSKMEVSKIESGQEQKVNFRKILITRCQTEFESNRLSRLDAARWLQEIKNCTDPEQKKELQLLYEEKERTMRRKSVENIRFIGELFKLGMLNSTIMYRCMEFLLRTPDEESLEGLCALLTVIGKDLEQSHQPNQKQPPSIMLNPYFQRMAGLAQKRDGSKVSSRVRFMLQDVIELRHNKWVRRREDNNRKAIKQITKEEERGGNNQSENEGWVNVTTSSRYHSKAPAFEASKMQNMVKNERGDLNSLSLGGRSQFIFQTTSKSMENKSGSVFTSTNVYSALQPDKKQPSQASMKKQECQDNNPKTSEEDKLKTTKNPWKPQDTENERGDLNSLSLGGRSQFIFQTTSKSMENKSGPVFTSTNVYSALQPDKKQPPQASMKKQECQDNNPKTTEEVKLKTTKNPWKPQDTENERGDLNSLSLGGRSQFIFQTTSKSMENKSGPVFTSTNVYSALQPDKKQPPQASMKKQECQDNNPKTTEEVKLKTTKNPWKPQDTENERGDLNSLSLGGRSQFIFQTTSKSMENKSGPVFTSTNVYSALQPDKKQPPQASMKKQECQDNNPKTTEEVKLKTTKNPWKPQDTENERGDLNSLSLGGRSQFIFQTTSKSMENKSGPVFTSTNVYSALQPDKKQPPQASMKKQECQDNNPKTTEEVKLKTTKNPWKPQDTENERGDLNSLSLGGRSQFIFQTTSKSMENKSGPVFTSTNVYSALQPDKKQPPQASMKKQECQDNNPKTTEEVKLKTTKNPWKPQDTEKLYKDVRGILNKLTPQKFDTLMKKFMVLPINSEQRLVGVINLIFDKAVDEPNFFKAYASMCRLCSKMEVSKIESGQEQKVNFRKIVITRCQTEFESNRLSRLDAAKWLQEIKNCTDPEQKKELQLLYEEKERTMRRKSVGNIRFIGELFKLEMLTTAIMYRCMEDLLRTPDEESLECLCALLTVIGEDLEHGLQPQPQLLDTYFQRMAELAQRKGDFTVSSKVRFLLQDVIELRWNQWVPRRECNNPKTFEQIIKEAKREPINHQDERMRINPVSRVRD